MLDDYHTFLVISMQIFFKSYASFIGCYESNHRNSCHKPNYISNSAHGSHTHNYSPNHTAHANGDHAASYESSSHPHQHLCTW